MQASTGAGRWLMPACADEEEGGNTQRGQQAGLQLVSSHQPFFTQDSFFFLTALALLVYSSFFI